jgi:hypothetical protein
MHKACKCALPSFKVPLKNMMESPNVLGTVSIYNDLVVCNYSPSIPTAPGPCLLFLLLFHTSYSNHAEQMVKIQKL